jgi:NTE family protein
VFPLFYDCDSSDVLLVLLSPLQHEVTPGTVEEIDARILELTFSANFLREMRMYTHAVDFSGRRFPPLGRLERRLRRMRFHMIDSREVASLKRAETKLLAHTPFLELLRDQGRERGEAWIAEHFEDVGRRSTVDVAKLFA